MVKDDDDDDDMMMMMMNLDSQTCLAKWTKKTKRWPKTRKTRSGAMEQRNKALNPSIL